MKQRRVYLSPPETDVLLVHVAADPHAAEETEWGVAIPFNCVPRLRQKRLRDMGHLRGPPQRFHEWFDRDGKFRKVSPSLRPLVLNFDPEVRLTRITPAEPVLQT